MKSMGPVQWEKICLQVNVRPSIAGAPLVKNKRHRQDVVAGLHASLGDTELLLEGAERDRDHYKQKLKDLLGVSPSRPKRAREAEAASDATGSDQDGMFAQKHLSCCNVQVSSFPQPSPGTSPFRPGDRPTVRRFDPTSDPWKFKVGRSAPTFRL